MGTEYRFLEFPLDVEVSVKEVPAGFDLDAEALMRLDRAIKVHVDNVAVDGWVPAGPVDAQTLIGNERLRFDDVNSLFGKKIRFVKVYLEFRPFTEVTPLCPSCDTTISRFDVYCRSCDFYLPYRPPAVGLEERLTRSWEVFEAKRAAELAAAGPKPPGVGMAIAKGVGAGILGLAGGIVGAAAKGIQEDMADDRLQRNISRGIRGAK